MTKECLTRWLSMVAACALVFSFLPKNEALSQPPVGDRLPDSTLLFVENVGQFPESVRFLVYGLQQGRLWLADDALWLTVDGGEQGQSATVRLTFPGADPHPHLEPFGPWETAFNYYHGNDPSRWHTDVPIWGGVRYVDLFPGVDLELTGEGNNWTWRLACRANCQFAQRDLRLRLEGANRVETLPSPTVGKRAGGEGLRLATAAGDLTLPLLTVPDTTLDGPPTVQHTAPETFEVTAPFASPTTHHASRITQHVIIEGDALHLTPPAPQDNPTHLLYSTFLGGEDDDEAYGLAVNGDGEAHVTGYTKTPGFPTTPGAVDTSFGGDSEIFVARLSADGSDLLYSTFLGGTGVYTGTVSEKGWDIALDGNGAAYIAGESNSDDFPTTPGAYSPTYIPASPDDVFPGSPPSRDLVVVQLDADGALVYSTYFAPPLADGMGIAVDESGVYVAGLVAASAFPTTEGAYNRTFGYSPDFFVLKFNLAGQGQDDLLYSSYVAMGATPMEPGAYETFGDMAVADGVVYVVGSTTGNFPITSGAYDTTFNGTHCVGGICPRNVVFFKLNPAGNGAADLLYSTYLGGAATINEQGEGIAVDAAGVVYLTGSTWAADFPTTPGAFDTTFNDGDGFVSKLNPAGNGAADLRYSTYLGGGWIDNGGYAISVDDAGDIYVVGDTYSDDFPVTPDAFQTFSVDYTDLFVTRLRPQGNGPADLVYSTYLGGDYLDYGRGIALGEGETVYVVGHTGSADWPTTPGAYDTEFGGGDCSGYPCDDAFVAKLNVEPSYLITGKVVDPEGRPILAVQVVAGGGYLGATGTSGEYTIADLEPGEYVLTPKRAGYFFSPEARTVTIPPSATGQDFTGYHILKESAIPDYQPLNYGDVLTYTVRILYPEARDVVLYDPVPTYTAYLSGSLSGPAGVVYDPAAEAISGSLSLTAAVPTMVTFAVRVEITGTGDFAPLILNQACVEPQDGGLVECDAVSNRTYARLVYLPLVQR